MKGSNQKAKDNTAIGFTDEEREAMKEHIKDQRLAASGKDGESIVMAKLNEMSEPDKSMGKKIHELIKKNAPELTPKTWYGMPAYANKEGKVICFFQGAEKFKARYSTLGFSDTARLDEGDMWPSSYALKKLGNKEEEMIVSLVKKAIS